MKKRFSYVMCVLLCIMMLAPVYARGTYMTDQAGVLSYQQADSLEAAAGRQTERLGFDVAVAYVESLNGQSAGSFADAYYDRAGYADDGILLLIAVRDREYWITVTGLCKDAFTASIIDSLGEKITPYLAADDWAQAGAVFLDAVSAYGGEPGSMQQSHNNFPWSGSEMVIILVVAAVIAGGTVWTVAAGMKTAKCQRGANLYLEEGSCHLTEKTDRFLYSTVTKTRKPEKQSHSSGGRTHSGGGGKF